MAIPRAGEKCCIHLVRFAKIEEFPDEEPDLDGVLSSFKAGRCQRNVLDRDSGGREITSEFHCAVKTWRRRMIRISSMVKATLFGFVPSMQPG